MNDIVQLYMSCFYLEARDKVLYDREPIDSTMCCPYPVSLTIIGVGIYIRGKKLTRRC